MSFPTENKLKHQKETGDTRLRHLIIEMSKAIKSPVAMAKAARGQLEEVSPGQSWSNLKQFSESIITAVD